MRYAIAGIYFLVAAINLYSATLVDRWRTKRILDFGGCVLSLIGLIAALIWIRG